MPLNPHFAEFIENLEIAIHRRPAASMPADLYKQSKEAWLEKAENALTAFVRSKQGH